VEDIPGVGRCTAERLHSINVRNVNELRCIPRRALVDLFGKNGATIYDRARGRDTRAVSEREVPTTISRETSFHRETADPAEVRAMLHYLVERAVKGARELGVVASRVGVCLRYSDFNGEEATARLRRQTDLEEDVYEPACTLLVRLWNRRVSLRLVGVTLSGLALKHGQQLDLFEPPNERGAALAAAVDDVRSRFGFSAITAGPSLDLLGKLRQETNGYVLRTPCLTK